MNSIYGIFPSEWEARNDFPLALDIKYYLLQVQSKLLAAERMHPILYPTHKAISKHFTSIVNRSEKELMLRFAPEILGLSQEQLELEVTLQIFNACLPNIFEYFDFVITNYGLQYLQDEMPGLPFRDYPYYTWGDFFGIWLPFDEHVVITKYQNMMTEKYPNGYGNE